MNNLAGAISLRHDIIDFIHAMAEADVWLAEEVCHFLEKPWKWQGEYDRWVSLGRPMPSDPGEAWDTFHAYIADPDRRVLA